MGSPRPLWPLSQIIFSIMGGSNQPFSAPSHTTRPPRGGRAELLPPGTPPWITMDLIRETVRVWQPYYSTPISLDDAVTILSRVGQLFSVLSEK
jgi:hypothetical protein